MPTDKNNVWWQPMWESEDEDPVVLAPGRFRAPVTMVAIDNDAEGADQVAGLVFLRVTVEKPSRAQRAAVVAIDVRIDDGDLMEPAYALDTDRVTVADALAEVARQLDDIAAHTYVAAMVFDAQRDTTRPMPPGADTYLLQRELARARRRPGSVDYDRVAEVYRQAVADGRSVTRAVAEAFDVSDGRASHLILRARKDGLLPPTKQGRRNA